LKFELDGEDLSGFFNFVPYFYKESNRFMYSNLCPGDIVKVMDLTEIKQRNNDFSWILFDYLNNNPCTITNELMRSVDYSDVLAEETAYCSFLAGFCGLDPERSQRDKRLVNDYLRRAVKKLNIQTYLENPYYQNIQIPEIKLGDWELIYDKYQPYETFIYKDQIAGVDFKEFPGIGFFNKEFVFPTVTEKAHEWMSIKPGEVETIQPVIDTIGGNVLTFGLGLGYFTYMASLKESIHNITVIEHDFEVIQIFERYILPQFQHKDKVKVVCSDAFEYAEKQMPYKNFDYAFVDLWHDVSDGIWMYLKMKKIEYSHMQTKFLYWIEDSLLSRFRWSIFDWAIKNVRSYEEIIKCLGNPFIRKLAATTEILDHIYAP
jgi:hypothetical protein